MTITINQRGGTYYIYKDLKVKNQEYEYYAEDTSSGWSWDSKEAIIYDNNKNEVALVSFNRRFFKPCELQITLYEDKNRIEFIPNNIWTWKDLMWSFEYKNLKYVFQEHRKHFRTLYKNDIQVAAFDKNYFSFFERDVINIYANKDENVLLLVCFAIYSDIGQYGDGEMITFNYGNMNGTKPPLGGKWRPNRT